MAADRLYGLVFNRKWDAATKLLQEASPEQVSYAVPHGWVSIRPTCFHASSLWWIEGCDPFRNCCSGKNDRN